jgi:hypothetical protein
MKPLAALALTAIAGAAVAQTQTTQPAQDSAARPRAPLKLNLDDIEPERPRVTFDKPDEKKKQEKPGRDLPGLGGPATREWERPSSKVFPPDTSMPKMPGDP